MAQAYTPAAEQLDENAMKRELEQMAQRIPAILADIQRDREEGERWVEQSRRRQQEAQLLLEEIQRMGKR